MSLSIKKAEPADMPAVMELLRTSDLTTAGLVEDAATILLVGDGAAVVGCAAVEVDGHAGLLRSLAVAAAARGNGLGRRLVSLAEAEARNLGVRRLYLLTTTAEGFFDKLGYRVMDRAQVPDVVRLSAEFSACSAADAVAMWRAV